MRLETVRKGREKENVDRRGKHLQPKPLVVWQGGVKLRCSGATFLRTLDSLSLSPFPPFFARHLFKESTFPQGLPRIILGRTVPCSRQRDSLLLDKEGGGGTRAGNLPSVSPKFPLSQWKAYIFTRTRSDVRYYRYNQKHFG